MRPYLSSASLSIGFSFLLQTGELASQQPRSDLPTYTLTLVKAEPLSVAMPSPMLEGPVGCLTDGSLVIHTILEMNPSRPSDPNGMLLSIIGRDGSIQTFDPQKISDLKNVRDTYVYDAGSRDVLLLVSGGPRAGETDPSSNPALYAARFDRHGAYQGSIPLPEGDFKTRKIAAFSPGDLLLFGVAKNRAGASLAHYSPTGASTVYYDPDTPFPVKNTSLPPPPEEDKLPQEIKGRLALQAAIDYSQFVHHKDSILLLQKNAGSTLYQVNPNGTIFTIALPKEDGFTANSVITSDESLYVRYTRAGTNNGRGSDAFIMEVNPTTGDAIRKILSEVSTVWDVSCVHNSDFTMVKMKDEHTFEFVTARLQ